MWRASLGEQMADGGLRPSAPLKEPAGHRRQLGAGPPRSDEAVLRAGSRTGRGTSREIQRRLDWAMVRELVPLRRRQVGREGRQAELMDVRPTLGILDDPRPHVFVEHEEIDGLAENWALARPAWAGGTLRRAFQIERGRRAVVDFRPELVRLMVKSLKVEASVEITGQDERNAPMGQIVDCLFEFIDLAGEDTDGDLVHTTFKDDLLSFSCLAVTAHASALVSMAPPPRERATEVDLLLAASVDVSRSVVR